LVNPDEKLVFALQVLDKNEREKVKLGHMKIKVGSNQSYYHFRADNDIPELQTCKNPQLEYYQLIENIGWIICNRVSAFRLLKSREKALQEKAGAFEGSLDSLITAEHKKYVST
jgi:hypothetical protein